VKSENAHTNPPRVDFHPSPYLYSLTQSPLSPAANRDSCNHEVKKGNEGASFFAFVAFVVKNKGEGVKGAG
jgi:hypothetical protein